MTQIERYRILEPLGAGGVADVHLADDLQLGRRVVLKVLRPAASGAGGIRDLASERFRRECTLLAGQIHTAIVPLLDWGIRADGAPYYTMPFLEGATTLEEVLAADTPKRRRPVMATLLDALADVAEGLDALHARGIRHRDVKPSNIVVVPPGRGLLIDLGLAAVAETGLTQDGAVIGTPSYMSPEQATGDAVGPRSDLYQLGLVLYEVATGTRAALDPRAYLTELARGRRPFPPPSCRHPGVGHALEEVILKATALEPDRRFASGRELIVAARAACTVEDAAPVRTAILRPEAGSLLAGRRGRARTWRRRQAVLLMAPLALLAMAVILTDRTAPMIDEVRVEAGLSGVRVRFRRTPPGPAAVRVAAAGRETRVLESGADAGRHAVWVPLAPGESATVQPFHGCMAGPALEVHRPPLSATDLFASRDALGLNVEFRTALPARARIRPGGVASRRWVDSDTEPATTHRLRVPWSLMPFAPDIVLELGDGADVVVERWRLERAARVAYLGGALDWFVDRIDRYRAAVRRPGLLTLPDPAALDRAAVELAGAFADRAFLAALGGGDGILDCDAIPLARRLTFYERMQVLERLEAASEVRGEPPRVAVALLYGSNFGPSLTPRYPHARAVPLTQLPLVDRSLLLDPRSLLSAVEGAGTTGRVSAIRASFRPEGAGAHVEIHVRALIPRARTIEVLVGRGVQLRMCRPGRDVPTDRPVDLYFAVPGAVLAGSRTLVFSSPRMSEANELLTTAPQVRVEPPGFELRVQ